MLIEYKITYGKSGVTITQRVEPSPSKLDNDTENVGVWRSLGQSYFEEPGGGGTESTAPGGGGTESTAPGGGASGSRAVIIFGPIVMLG